MLDPGSLQQMSRALGVAGPGVAPADSGADSRRGRDARRDRGAYFTPAPLVEYVVVNVSSPNTPGLRDLQTGEALKKLLTRLLAKRDALIAETGTKRPVFLKIAPDLDQPQMKEIAGAISASTLDGLIVSNTTISRHEIANSQHSSEAGGLSGKPLFDRSTIILARMRKLLGKDLPIIGVGGIDSAETAWSKLEAGADLLQLYTGMVYRGPCIASQINRGLLQKLRAEKLDHISQVSGRANEDWAARSLPGGEG
ncbi:MAG: dihydroorotate dehydrogenase (quinone) [Myxococcota bacterium]